MTPPPDPKEPAPVPVEAAPIAYSLKLLLKKCEIAGRVGVCREVGLPSLTKPTRILSLELEESSITAIQCGVRVLMAARVEAESSERERAIFNKCTVKSDGVGLVFGGKGLFRLASCTVQSAKQKRPLVAIGRDLTGICESGTLGSKTAQAALLDFPSVSFLGVEMDNPAIYNDKATIVTNEDLYSCGNLQKAFNTFRLADYNKAPTWQEAILCIKGDVSHEEVVTREYSNQTTYNNSLRRYEYVCTADYYAARDPFENRIMWLGAVQTVPWSVGNCYC